MKQSEKFEKEVSSLVKEGAEIVERASSADDSLQGAELARFTTWVSRAGNIIKRLYSSDSQYSQNYDAALKTEGFYIVHSNWHGHVSQIHGILCAVKYDIENGLVDDIKGLLQADIFSDFLEMAEHLLDEGYKDPAAVVVGAVLEDSLRKLCDKHEILTKNNNGKPLTIDPLNTALTKNGVYDKLVSKQITSWADLRNSAAHGEFGKYDATQVKHMLLFVQKFSSDYLV